MDALKYNGLRLNRSTLTANAASHGRPPTSTARVTGNMKARHLSTRTGDGQHETPVTPNP
ncbi:hypothetical protein EJB05_15663 [Eragrostis curvula]|uniref:Uncharacterized protein n=1 Tax=Eragrostis curvula TaxID=38414 RepID=A0A5J9VG47_9POAL|nr:hypothetical protein EJB05_15663 [Eragrostis curvula]